MIVKAAGWYRERGFSVIPIKPNKKPYIKWERFQSEKADLDQIRSWWKKWPAANIGIVTGKISGVMVASVSRC